MARRKERIDALAVELGNALVIVCDVTQPEQVHEPVDRTVAQFGRIDALINNAGQGLHANIEEIKIEDFRDLLDLNFIAPLTVQIDDSDAAGAGQFGDAAGGQEGAQAMDHAVVSDDGAIRVGAAVQTGAIAVGRSEDAKGDALGLAARAEDQDLLAYGWRAPVADEASAQGGLGQPAGQQLAALNPNPGRAFV